jgi:hypothetical protein
MLTALHSPAGPPIEIIWDFPPLHAVTHEMHLVCWDVLHHFSQDVIRQDTI